MNAFNTRVLHVIIVIGLSITAVLKTNSVRYIVNKNQKKTISLVANTGWYKTSKRNVDIIIRNVRKHLIIYI